MTRTQQLTLEVAADELKRCEDMAQMILEGEWAEHAGKGPISNKVEAAFTQLLGEIDTQLITVPALHSQLGEATDRIASLNDDLANTKSALREANERISQMKDKLERYRHQWPGA